METAVSVAALTKKFGDFIAVDSLDLKVSRGGIFGLLGPNGAGKTTLIRILCGLALPTSGRVEVLGGPPHAARHRVGYMPQETALYHDMTTHDNISFFGRLYSMQKDRLARRERELLKLIGLEDWRDSLVSTLSGGMRHRVSLACALVHEPELLFLDEPTVGIDPELRAAFWTHFKTLSKGGTTVFITTHYMDEARHCDDIVFLQRGRVLVRGTPAGILAKAGAANLEDAFLTLARRGKDG
jgi:ABC-2 type transport system ATP-binding protein